MAGRCRVLVDELRDLANPKYRIGDKIRQLKHSIADDDEQIRDIVVEVGHDDNFQATKSFGLPADGHVKLGSVLFVKAPPKGILTVRVLKSHRIQKDALIGEAQVRSAPGKQTLTLMRKEQPRGELVIEVSDGLPGSVSSAAGAAVLPSAAIKRDSDPAPAPAPKPAGCMDFINGLVDMVHGFLGCIGLRDPTEAFLAAKAKDSDYTVMPSGLMYKVLRKGAGTQRPTIRSSCDCQYEGRLINGVVFDSSVKHGGPQTFTVGEVVKGWTEALQLMVEGDKFELIVPPSLGYRDKAIKREEDGKVLIPANSVLVFQMELLRIRSSSWGGGRH